MTEKRTRMSATAKHSAWGALGALLLSLTTGGAMAAPPTPPSGDSGPGSPSPTAAPTSPPATTPPASAPSSDKPEEEGDQNEPADEAADAEPSNKEDGKASEAIAEGKPVATSDPAPEAKAPLAPDAQSPAPVALVDSPRPKARALEIGAFVGASNRPSEEDSITYGPAVAWGFYARPELRKWLGLRLYYREESIPVTVDRGGFDADTSFGATDFDQPNLRLRSLGARIEPTWVAAPRLRVMAVIGVSWLRFVAPGATSEGEYELRTADRSAVELDFQGGVGASYELLPDWLTIGAQFMYGIASQRTGTAYEDVQAFSDGKRYTMGPLPRFDGVTDLLFSLGLIL